MFVRFLVLYFCLFSFACRLSAQSLVLPAGHADLRVNDKGFIYSIKDRKTKKEYCPAGMSSALLSLYKDTSYILPIAATFAEGGQSIQLKYPNGSVARIKAVKKGNYLRLQLVSLENPNGVDNIVWGPYKTNISRTIGELICVVRSEEYAIGILPLDDNTTSGPPVDGDMVGMYYYIHSPDPKKYPLPSHLKEGQCFKIGGDGKSDIAFYSQPEEYYRMCYGNGASLEPAFGSSITLHARDRRKEQMILFPQVPKGVDAGVNSARHQLVTPADAGMEGSAIAFYCCPDDQGLSTIESIVLAEGLPHPEMDGKWIKTPSAYRPDIAWWGVHDSLASYAHQLGLKGVQDEGWGEYYPNPANRWTQRGISLNSGKKMTIKEYGLQMQRQGIRYGMHTLCEFLQPDNNSDVAPMPNDSLAIMQRTTLTAPLSATDTIITVTDTCHFSEFGGWEGNETNVLKIGKELIEYDGITSTRPYAFLHVKRGVYGTRRGDYKAGDTIVKLQPNCYRGFAPDINLQDRYADYYGRWLTEGGMDYIDFDGLESCMYQGHGQYSFKRFFRNLFDSYKANGGKYLRVMGSAVNEGSWHYMSVCNVGGGDRMFSPVLNKWGIEGKDMRYVFESNYFPATFGINSLESDWSLYDAENLEAKSIGWNATYMLGLSQHSVEASGNKQEIFAAYRAWENARAAGAFTAAQRAKLKDLSLKFHLEQLSPSAFTLYTLKESRYNLPYSAKGAPVTLTKEETGPGLIELAIRVRMPEHRKAAGLRIVLPDGRVARVNDSLSDGQFILYKDHELYLADKGRKKLATIMIKPLFTGRGGQVLMIGAAGADRGAGEERTGGGSNGNSGVKSGDKSSGKPGAKSGEKSGEKISLELVTTVEISKEQVGR